MKLNGLEDGAVNCPHLESNVFGSVCPHIYAVPKDGYTISFTGHDLQYDLVCGKCARDMETSRTTFIRLCENCFRAVEEQGFEEYVLIGQPQVREKPISLQFVHQEVSLKGWGERKLLCIQSAHNELSQWVALSSDGELLRLDFESATATFLMQLPSDSVELNEHTSLHLSPNFDFVAVANNKGVNGCIVHLETKSVSMLLKRDDYCNEHCIFTVAFFINDNRLLVVHATAWNRLDISDPLTGKLLTQRESPTYTAGTGSSEHYLDYFHAGLTISPDNKWIVDNGWVWHPVGVVRCWNLQKWVSSNVWESEDGESVRKLCARDYFWDGPLCWIDNKTLAVWGFGRDDECLIPAILLFDVESGKRIRWFAGPQGELTFDKYLFSSSSEFGTSIWDIETGERLHHADQLYFLSYHRGTKEFVSYSPDGQFFISRLSEEL